MYAIVPCSYSVVARTIVLPIVQAKDTDDLVGEFSLKGLFV